MMDYPCKALVSDGERLVTTICDPVNGPWLRGLPRRYNVGARVEIGSCIVRKTNGTIIIDKWFVIIVGYSTPQKAAAMARRLRHVRSIEPGLIWHEVGGE